MSEAERRIEEVMDLWRKEQVRVADIFLVCRSGKFLKHLFTLSFTGKNEEHHSLDQDCGGDMYSSARAVEEHGS